MNRPPGARRTTICPLAESHPRQFVLRGQRHCPDDFQEFALSARAAAASDPNADALPCWPQRALGPSFVSAPVRGARLSLCNLPPARGLEPKPHAPLPRPRPRPRSSTPAVFTGRFETGVDPAHPGRPRQGPCGKGSRTVPDRPPPTHRRRPRGRPRIPGTPARPAWHTRFGSLPGRRTSRTPRPAHQSETPLARADRSRPRRPSGDRSANPSRDLSQCAGRP